MVGVAVWGASVVVRDARRKPREQPPATVSYPGSIGAPQRMWMPAVGIDTEMIPLGLDGSGHLEPPASTEVAGWFQDGPEPGEPGTVVVAGHLDSKTGPAVFAGLRDARQGDIIHFTAHGRTAVYVVQRVAEYPKASIPSAEVYRHTAKKELRVITCGGTWNAAQHHYRDNVVVYAVEL